MHTTATIFQTHLHNNNQTSLTTSTIDLHDFFLIKALHHNHTQTNLATQQPRNLVFPPQHRNYGSSITRNQAKNSSPSPTEVIFNFFLANSIPACEAHVSPSLHTTCHLWSGQILAVSKGKKAHSPWFYIYFKYPCVFNVFGPTTWQPGF